MNCCNSYGKCTQGDDCPVRTFYNLHGQDVEEFTPLCPPCNQTCNQGRSCPARATKLVSGNGGNVIDDGKALPPKDRRLGFRICCLSAGAVIGFGVGFYNYFY